MVIDLPKVTQLVGDKAKDSNIVLSNTKVQNP